MASITLSKPVQAHGKDITEITFREPNGGDVAACGFPFRFTVNEDQTQTIEPQAAAITQMMSRLGDVPLSTIRALPFSDWMEGMGAVFTFFGTPTPAALSGGALTSRGSGNGSLA
jgi:hypothetical protein